MAGITFRDRKYKRQLDASFSLWDGNNLGDVSSYHVGDIVGVCFADLHEKQDAIKEHCPMGFDFFANDGFIQVLCVVVKRHHSIVWKSVGRFDSLTTCNVVLEAESGYWEDVLKWIVTNEKPKWIPDDEQ
jgi:hypothetical protein